MDTFSELEQKLSDEVPGLEVDIPVNSISIPLQSDAITEDAPNISDIENTIASISSPIVVHELKEPEISTTTIQEDGTGKLQPIEYDSQESSQRHLECMDDLSRILSAVQTFENDTMLELSRSSWGTEEQLYLQGCKWSPDQTCILTAVNKNGMHIFELPRDLYDMEVASNERSVDILQSVVFVRENGTIYDYCWYPNMNSLIPATCW